MAKFEMDTDFVRKLAEILDETGLGEIEFADGERRIRVARPTVTALLHPVAAAAPAAALAGCRRRGRLPAISASIPAP